MNAVADTEFIFFQKYFIPEKSMAVRYSMYYAADWAKEGNFFTSRIVSVAFITMGIAFSIFNVFSYTLQIPLQILIDIVSFQPFSMFFHCFENLTNVIRSLFFFHLGTLWIISGLIFPKEVIAKLAIDSPLVGEERLRLENARLVHEIERLKKELDAYRRIVKQSV